jgi:hypothetical protein
MVEDVQLTDVTGWFWLIHIWGHAYTTCLTG